LVAFWLGMVMHKIHHTDVLGIRNKQYRGGAGI
jgi:hypothetical protein